MVCSVGLCVRASEHMPVAGIYLQPVCLIIITPGARRTQCALKGGLEGSLHVFLFFFVNPIISPVHGKIIDTWRLIIAFILCRMCSERSRKLVTLLESSSQNNVLYFGGTLRSYKFRMYYGVNFLMFQRAKNADIYLTCGRLHE